MKTVKVVISGHVQGVGFRQFIKQNALKVGVRGWIRNSGSKEVVGVFQGEVSAIDDLIAACRKGPMLSKVKDVTVFELDSSVEKFEDFEVLKTISS